MFNTHQQTIETRFYHLTDELSGVCDPDFDADYEELEREFQELRLQLGNDE